VLLKMHRRRRAFARIVETQLKHVDGDDQPDDRKRERTSVGRRLREKKGRSFDHLALSWPKDGDGQPSARRSLAPRVQCCERMWTPNVILVTCVIFEEAAYAALLAAPCVCLGLVPWQMAVYPVERLSLFRTHRSHRFLTRK
jgi:hypothetical protein